MLFSLQITSIMSQTKELTLAEIAGHNTKKDLYMTVHDKVYDVSAFVDEHPYVGHQSPPNVNKQTNK